MWYHAETGGVVGLGLEGPSDYIHTHFDGAGAPCPAPRPSPPPLLALPSQLAEAGGNKRHPVSRLAVLR